MYFFLIESDIYPTPIMAGPAIYPFADMGIGGGGGIRTRGEITPTRPFQDRALDRTMRPLQGKK